MGQIGLVVKVQLNRDDYTVTNNDAPFFSTLHMTCVVVGDIYSKYVNRDRILLLQCQWVGK